MAPPPSTVVPPVVALVVRSVTFVLIFVAVIVMATNKIAGAVKFSDFYAYRYMLAAGVIGMAYTLLQAALSLLHVISGNKIGGDGLSIVDFFGDKLVSYLLATGAAACFGLTVDLKRMNEQGPGEDSDTGNFLNKANAAAAILFIGFIFSAMSSIFSCLSLPKRG